MAYSTQEAVSDGTLVLLSVSIQYLDRDEISVYYDGIVNTTNWSWVGDTGTQIHFSPAVPIGTVVSVKRSTYIGEVLHDFTGGAAFIALSLDENYQQILHIAQEATEGSLGGEFFTDVDMHGHKIVNLAPAVASTDALQYGQFQDEIVPYVAAADASADAAALSANAAAVSAAAALVSEPTAASAAIVQVNAGNTNAVLRTAIAGAALIPSGALAARPTPTELGMFRFNESTDSFEGVSSGGWGSVGGASGGAGNPFCYENDRLITANYTIKAGKNAMSAGPIEITDGITVTIPDGSTWSIV